MAAAKNKRTTDWRELRITDGAGQRDRYPPAFAEHFRADELSYPQLLALGAEFAAMLKFYNLRNEVDGDWGELFNADEAIVMASIVALRPARLEAQFFAIPYGRIDRLIDFLLQLAAKIDFWYRRLGASGNESGEALARQIGGVIGEKLAAELHNLYRIAQLTEAGPLAVAPRVFDPVWAFAGGEESDTLPLASIERLPDDGNVKRRLATSFYLFSNAVAYIREAAEAGLQKSLLSQRHEPSIGLFLVFARLYARAQSHLNRFTLRHLDFYYREVLRAANRDAEAPAWYLLLAVNAGSDALRIARGTGFSAGRDANFEDIVYRADSDTRVSDIALSRLATLCLQRDSLISPEADLGYVARLKSAWLPVAPADAQAPLSSAWPLLGAVASGAAQPATVDADLGFSIASSTLLLEQGERKIRLDFELEPERERDVPIATAVDALTATDSAVVFRDGFGRLFARYLLGHEGFLDPGHKTRLAAKALELLAAESAREIERLLAHDRQGLFYKLFKQSLRVRLTGVDGWLDIAEYYLRPLSASEESTRTGFSLSLQLGPEAPAIVAYLAERHGGRLATRLPVLQCLLQPQSSFCVYSVFSGMRVSSLRIEVEASGLDNLRVYNQQGQLDAGKPFQPFGPLPDSDAYFVFGNHELARKSLLGLRINVEWSALPGSSGGFEAHYAGYPSRYRNDSFVAEFTALVDGRWLPRESELRSRFRLFDSDEDDRVAPRRSVGIGELDFVKPIDGALDAGDYRYDLSARQGFFRVSLVEPGSAFGHGEHGPTLTKALSANARLIRLQKPLPMPNPPYTPTIGRLTLDYRAGTTLEPARPFADSDEQDGQLFHHHPFGHEQVYPAAPDRPCYLLPRYDTEGNLFIGLSGKRVGGPLSLLFHLAQNRLSSAVPAAAKVVWFYLTANTWQEMKPERVLADGTYGLQASGIVTLDIPADIDRANSVMPAGLFWLRLSLVSGAERLPACYSIQPHALRVSLPSKTDARPVDAGAAWKPLSGLPGLSGVNAAIPAFGGREAESDRHFRQRVSERLRHKGRASTPWDYERLVLEAFPDIEKVKCFPGISSTEDRIEPGRVLLVVVPRVQEVSGAACANPLIDGRRLEEIRVFVRDRGSPFAEIEVRNPQYEHIQVRCRVRFADQGSAGMDINRLDRQISNYICPWRKPGYQARFGWRIRQQDIESHILNLDYVKFVTDFSMLHITVDNEGSYSLFDTARQADHHEAVIRPRYPWSLALPFERHFIETTEQSRSVPAEVTGVDELAIGGTFIIVGSRKNGEKK